MGCFLMITADSEEVEATNFSDTTFQYTTVEGGVQVVGFKDGLPASSKVTVTIPSSASDGSQSYPVVSVKTEAFKNQSDIKNVTIPDSVTSLENNAFLGCSNVEQFQFGEGKLAGTVTIGLDFKDTASGTAITDPNKLWGQHFTKTSGNLLRDSHLVSLVYKFPDGDLPGRQAVLKGNKLVEPTVRDGYMAEGWYKTETFTDKWNFDTVVTEDMTLYGKIVLVKVTSITINNPESDFDILKGSSLKINVTVLPSNAKDKSVTYSCSDTSVAEFKATSAEKSVLVAKSKGVARITVTANDGSGVKATHDIQVISGEEYTITITDDGHGKATANKEKAKFGDVIVLTATPDSEYKFSEWESDDVVVIDNKFTMPDNAVKIKACFRAEDIPITIADSENGAIIGPDKVEKWTDGEYSFLANDGYLISEIKVDGEVVVKNQATYVLKNVTQTHTISAVFVAHEGAESDIGLDGSITQRYKFDYGSTKIDVEEHFMHDGTATFTAGYADLSKGILAVLQGTINAQYQSEAEGVCELKYNADTFATTIKEAESVTSAMAHYRNASMDLAINVETDAGGQPINIVVDIGSYDGSYNVEIDGDIAKIGMDKTAMKFIKSKTNEMKVSVKIADKKDMTAMQAWIVEDYKPYEIDINGIHSFDGKIKLAVPLVLGEGQSKDKAAVYYVGLYHAEKIGGTYDEEEKIITVDLPHLSYYFAAADYKESPNGKPGTFSIGIFAAFLIVIILLLAVCVTFAMNYVVDSGKLYLKIPAKPKK